jgi:hypothetical protein
LWLIASPPAYNVFSSKISQFGDFFKKMKRTPNFFSGVMDFLGPVFGHI